MEYAARIAEGLVVEVVQLPDDVALADAFHPGAGFVEADNTVTIGMAYADGVFRPAPEPESPILTKADLVAYARQRRWQIEVGGINVGGIPIVTDEESQRKILGAYVAATRDPSWSTLWDSIHPVDAAAMIAIGDEVQAHINASFVKRGAIFVAIEAGAITTTAEIDAAFGL